MSKTKSIIFFKHAHFIVLLFKKLWDVRINYEDIKKSSFYSLKNQIFIRGKTQRKDLQRINFNSTIFPINLSSPRSLKDPNSQWGIAAPKVRGEENSRYIKVLSDSRKISHSVRAWSLRTSAVFERNIPPLHSF